MYLINYQNKLKHITTNEAKPIEWGCFLYTIERTTPQPKSTVNSAPPKYLPQFRSPPPLTQLLLPDNTFMNYIYRHDIRHSITNEITWQLRNQSSIPAFGRAAIN